VCTDGIFYPDDDVDSRAGEDGDDAASIPGFGLFLSIIAALGAALLVTRRE
jgi:PGF-CTERM protein